LYSFRVNAKTFNGIGASTPAESFKFFACQKPSKALAPTRVTTDTTSITVAWSDPADTGGCVISSFAVFMDDGAGGAFSEVNSVSDSNVRNNPALHTLKITSGLSALSSIGKSYRIYVRSFNADD